MIFKKRSALNCTSNLKSIFKTGLADNILLITFKLIKVHIPYFFMLLKVQ